MCSKKLDFFPVYIFFLYACADVESVEKSARIHIIWKTMWKLNIFQPCSSITVLYATKNLSQDVNYLITKRKKNVYRNVMNKRNLLNKVMSYYSFIVLKQSLTCSFEKPFRWVYKGLDLKIEFICPEIDPFLKFQPCPSFTLKIIS